MLIKQIHSDRKIVNKIVYILLSPSRFPSIASSLCDKQDSDPYVDPPVLVQKSDKSSGIDYNRRQQRTVECLSRSGLFIHLYWFVLFSRYLSCLFYKVYFMHSVIRTSAHIN